MARMRVPSGRSESKDLLATFANKEVPVFRS